MNLFFIISSKNGRDEVEELQLSKVAIAPGEKGVVFNDTNLAMTQQFKWI